MTLCNIAFSPSKNPIVMKEPLSAHLSTVDQISDRHKMRQVLPKCSLAKSSQACRPCQCSRRCDPEVCKALTFAGLPTFCPINFHLFASYSLIAVRRAELCKDCQRTLSRLLGWERGDGRNFPRLPQTRHNACPGATAVISTV